MLLFNRAVDNRTYNPADYDSSYIATTGIHGGGQNYARRSSIIPSERYGYRKAFSGYASNKHRKDSQC